MKCHSTALSLVDLCFCFIKRFRDTLIQLSYIFKYRMNIFKCELTDVQSSTGYNALVLKMWLYDSVCCLQCGTYTFSVQVEYRWTSIQRPSWIHWALSYNERCLYSRYRQIRSGEPRCNESSVKQTVLVTPKAFVVSNSTFTQWKLELRRDIVRNLNSCVLTASVWYCRWYSN